jgi:LuxR family maltose regulon positive regulatory protein
MGQDGVDEDLLGQILERSEGWVTGIRLAQLWLGQRGDPADVVDAFHGSHRDIADYLTEEVINCLPDGVEKFLVATSVPNEFNASLVHALVNVADGREMLNQVERQGLFLVPLDNERDWYRYHPLFREFLTSRLRSRFPDMESDLARRTALWFEANCCPVESAQYYLRSGDPHAAARMLDQVAEHLLLQQGETYKLIGLVEQLPDETRQAFPALHRFYAWALVLTGRLDEAEMLVRGFELRVADMAPDEARSHHAEIAGIRSRIAAYRADHEATITYAQSALELAEPSNDWFRADALLSLGFALRAVGRIYDAADVFGQASALGRICEFPHAALWGSRYQALTYISQGRLRDADELIERDIESARAVGFDRGAAFAAILVGRGELLYERNDLHGARRDLVRALGFAQQAGDAKILMNVYVALALLEEAEGSHEKARLTSRRAVRVFGGPGERASEAWLALRHGDLPAVRSWMESYTASEGYAASLSKGESEQIMLGRALMAISGPSEARPFLAELLAQAEASGRLGRALVIRILLANAADAEDFETQVVEHVRHVLDIALRERYVRSVIDEGQGFLRILRQMMRQEHDARRRQYAGLILAAAEAGDGPELGDATSFGLLEPLTVRQRDVLRLMIDGRSNRETADDLFVAEGTVKAHIHQIYGKMMVRNRAEAIKAAHDLKIFA